MLTHEHGERTMQIFESVADFASAVSDNDRAE